MAEFGPEVFNSLANVADKFDDYSFVTAKDVTECGLSERIPHASGVGMRSTHEAIEEFKNAIFKLLMLRARDYLIANPDEKEKAHTLIKMTIFDDAIHPELLDFDKSNSNLFKSMVIIPRLEVDFHNSESPEIQETAAWLNLMTLACSGVN